MAISSMELPMSGLFLRGISPIPVFVSEQDRLIRQRHALLQTAVDRARGSGDDHIAADDLSLYRAQWQRVLSMTLFFLEIRHQDGQLYKIGVTDQSVDDYAARLERDLRPLLGPTQVNKLYALAHQGAVERYALHRCGSQEKFAVIAGCLLLDFPAGIVSELEELGDRHLDELETEILNGRWVEGAEPSTVTVMVPDSAQRSAYHREVELKEYHITCKQCGKQVSLWRYPGRPPTLCSDECERKYRREHDRAKTRERVRRYRARQEQQQETAR